MDKVGFSKTKVLHVYEPTLGIKVLAWLRAVWFLIVGIPMAFIATLIGGIGFLVAFISVLFMFEALWYAIMLTKNCTLTIYETGISLQRGQASLFCEWENMSHPGRFRWSDWQYGIHFYDELEPKENGFIEKYLFGNSQNFLRLNDMLIIGNNIFQNEEQLKQQVLRTALGQDLLHYAPHLFEDEKEKAKNL
jgi:hypothetical protein